MLETHETVGDLLRLTREARGLTIADIARETRIPARYLNALEQGQWDILPAKPYVYGFSRTYAHHIGLDPVEIVEKIKAEGSVLPDGHTQFPSEPMHESKQPGLKLVGASIVTCLALIGGWYAYTQSQIAPSSVPEQVAADNFSSDPLQNNSAAAGPGAIDPTAGSSTAPVLSQSAAPPLNQPAEPDPLLAEVGNQASNQSPVANTGTGQPAVDEPGIVIRAREESWIRVVDGNAAVIRVGILAAGESFTLPDVAGLRLTTGNAGGIEIFVDGKATPSLGPTGRPARNIPLSRTTLKTQQ